MRDFSVCSFTSGNMNCTYSYHQVQATSPTVGGADFLEVYNNLQNYFKFLIQFWFLCCVICDKSSKYLLNLGYELDGCRKFHSNLQILVVKLQWLVSRLIIIISHVLKKTAISSKKRIYYWFCIKHFFWFITIFFGILNRIDLVIIINEVSINALKCYLALTCHRSTDKCLSRNPGLPPIRFSVTAI